MMYLHHILSREESELIHRIYKTQITSNSPGDWVRLVQSDKLELNITLTDEEIQGVSKNVFRNYVKEKARNTLEILVSHRKNIPNQKQWDVTNLRRLKNNYCSG